MRGPKLDQKLHATHKCFLGQFDEKRTSFCHFWSIFGHFWPFFDDFWSIFMIFGEIWWNLMIFRFWWSVMIFDEIWWADEIWWFWLVACGFWSVAWGFLKKLHLRSPKLMILVVRNWWILVRSVQEFEKTAFKIEILRSKFARSVGIFEKTAFRSPILRSENVP